MTLYLTQTWVQTHLSWWTIPLKVIVDVNSIIKWVNSIISEINGIIKQRNISILNWTIKLKL